MKTAVRGMGGHYVLLANWFWGWVSVFRPDPVPVVRRLKELPSSAAMERTMPQFNPRSGL